MRYVYDISIFIYYLAEVEAEPLVIAFPVRDWERDNSSKIVYFVTLHQPLK